MELSRLPHVSQKPTAAGFGSLPDWVKFSV